MALIKILFVLTAILFAIYDIYEFHKKKIDFFNNINILGDVDE